MSFQTLKIGYNRNTQVFISQFDKTKHRMSSFWIVGNHVKVQGMPRDYKILSYNFISGGYVEMILESTEGHRIFLKRRKSQISDIQPRHTIEAGSNDDNFEY